MLAGAELTSELCQLWKFQYHRTQDQVRVKAIEAAISQRERRIRTEGSKIDSVWLRLRCERREPLLSQDESLNRSLVCEVERQDVVVADLIRQ